MCNMLLVDPVQTNVRKQRKTLTQPSRQCIVSSLHLYGSFVTTALLFYEMNVTCANERPVHLMLYMETRSKFGWFVCCCCGNPRIFQLLRWTYFTKYFSYMMTSLPLVEDFRPKNQRKHRWSTTSKGLIAEGHLQLTSCNICHIR